MYKLIASDLDGTLLRSDKTISKKTIQILTQLSNKGVLFVPSTGRTHKELPAELLELPFLHYGLCVNGGGIYDYKKNEYVYEETIDTSLALEILDYADKLDVYSSFVIRGNRYLPTNKNGDIIDYIKSVAVPSILKQSHRCNDMKTFIQQSKYGVQKFLFYSKDASKTQELCDILTKQFQDLSVCMSGPLYIEINAKSVNKGNGLNFLCKYIGIPIEDTIAFGDASNDLDLLKSAGYAVAMENGTSDIKKYADEIADTCDHDGLRKVLEKLYM